MAHDNAHKRQFFDEKGSYVLPNDAEEHDRLETQAKALNAIMNNQPFHAPVKNPNRILDIGCGTGVITVALAKAYPDAEVIGLDLSPVPDRHEKPANITYIQGDVRELAKGGDERIAKGTFDYVFHRLLVLGMTEWPSYVAAVTSLLKPGGYAEMQELDMMITSAGGTRTSVTEWFYPILLEDSRAMGLDIQVAGKLTTLMKDAGLGNVTEKVYTVPLMPAADTPNGELVRKIQQDSQRLANRVILDRICGPRRSVEELEKMYKGLDASIENRKPGDHGKLYVASGQKSMDA